MTLRRRRRSEVVRSLIVSWRRPGHLLGSGGAVYAPTRVPAGTEVAWAIARVRIPGRIRLSETAEAGPRGILLRLAIGRGSAAVDVIHAMLSLNGCALPSIAGKEMLIVDAARNRAGAGLPVRRMEALTRRRHRVCAGHHAGLAECSWVDSRLLHRHARAAELIALHRADPSTHPWVADRSIKVREGVRTFSERIHAAEI